MTRIAKFISGRRTSWLIVVVGILIAVAGFGVGQAERNASPLDTLPVGFDSTEGQALLESLPDKGERTAIVLFTVEDGGIEQFLPALSELVNEVSPAEGGQPAPVIPAEDGTAAIGIIEVTAPSASIARDVVTELRTDLTEAVPEEVSVQVTGPAAIEADLASVFDGANFTLLAVTAAIVAILLIATYRSPFLWIVPLTVVGLADQLASTVATHVLKFFGVPWSESTIGILSVLVFGAGTNYALLLISRYRDELRVHDSRREAMTEAVKRAAEPIIASASTVVVGVLCLLLSIFPDTRGLGLACAVGIIMAMVAALVVLPAALVLFGRWIFWPRVPQVGEALLADGRSLWRRIGDRVAKTPVKFIVATVLVLAAMAAGLTQLRAGLAPEDQFLETPEAIVAAQRMAESFPAGVSDPMLIVTRTDDPAQLAALAEQAAAVDGIDQATPGDIVEGIGRVNLVMANGSGSDEAAATVAQLREVLSDSPETYVTGGEASSIDAADGHSRDRMVIMPVILVLVLIALMGLLRSILAPIILISSVVATFAAALGVSWWLFTGIFDFGAVDHSMPLLAFLFLVALGIDYNIFLITRTLEEAKVVGTRDGVLRALGATGGVITSAGILLAAVFAVLGVLPLVVLAQIGVVICIGVLMDTLVVRTVLVPAIVRVLGEKFWWPRKVAPAEQVTPSTNH